MYTPEHIETSHFENDYQETHESKGGYSVAKLLEQRGGGIGGSLNESNERSGGSVGGGSNCEASIQQKVGSVANIRTCGIN